MYNIVKGTKVTIRRMVIKPNTCLAGQQLKFGGDFQEFEGVVRHIRGNHPTEPTSVRLWVEPVSGDFTKDSSGTEFCEKCGCIEIGEINPDHVASILE